MHVYVMDQICIIKHIDTTSACRKAGLCFDNSEHLSFEFVFQSGNTQQCRSPSLALEVAWRGTIWGQSRSWNVLSHHMQGRVHPHSIIVPLPDKGIERQITREEGRSNLSSVPVFTNKQSNESALSIRSTVCPRRCAQQSPRSTSPGQQKA